MVSPLPIYTLLTYHSKEEKRAHGRAGTASVGADSAGSAVPVADDVAGVGAADASDGAPAAGAEDATGGGGGSAAAAGGASAGGAAGGGS